MVEKSFRDIPDFYDDLDKTYDNIWSLLTIGKAKSKSEMHQGYIATVNKDYPSIRTVVLRHVNKETNSISFHTDIRSNKVNELKDNDMISMLFYDHGKKIQIKVSGIAEINHKNDKAQEAWANTRSFSKKCYIVEVAPGTHSDTPVSGYLPEHEKDLPSEEILNKGYDNFALVEIKIESIEWLYLHRHGHRRALFKRNNEELTKEWLTP